MIHIVLPEGLNRAAGAAQVLSSYYEACLRRAAADAGAGDELLLAPGNAFGQSRPEDAIAEELIARLRPDLKTHRVESERHGYLDTMDNALRLRDWAIEHDRWPLGECRVYCNLYHAVRVRLCFSAAGYHMTAIVRCRPSKRDGLIVWRLKYYDYPVLNLLYEILATAHALPRMVQSLVFGRCPRGPQR